MRNNILTTSLVVLSLVACGSSQTDEQPTSEPAPALVPAKPIANGEGKTGTGTGSGTGTSGPDAPAPTTAPPADPADPAAPAPVDPNAGAGPAPTAACTITKDAAGFFTRGSGASSYVGYVPASYSSTAPMRLIVGLHGCGDNAMNYATWGVNPFDTRTTQDHIGISIGGADGRCWTAADDAKVAAAIADISSCFWVHQKKVVVSGFSSGGQLAYRVGLSNASSFAGILIEDSGLYAAGTPDALLANASWKINIAHRAHTADTVFPIGSVKADWAKTTAAGFPLLTSETPGGHDGTAADWATWLIPQSAGWTAP